MDFEALAKQHKDAVYRQMMRVCGNREDAEDVLIEALMNAYRHIGQLRDSEAFRAWLAQIARRVCWQLKEREAFAPLLQLSAHEEQALEIPSGEPPVDAQIAARQMKTLLEKALAQLPPDFRRVYELRDIRGLSGSEVAARLGLSTAAMKSRLHRAREMLRVHLDDAVRRESSQRTARTRGTEPHSASGR